MRHPRIFLPGISLHVIHRGHNRMQIYQRDSDYAVFLTLLRRATNRHGVAVHAYTLMTTHVHLIVTPAGEPALARAIRELAWGYTRYYNREYTRIGTVWNGRYRSLPIRDERYWLMCLRYVEQNPVRAGMVRRSDEYRWSSYRAHAHGQWEEWLEPHRLYRELGTTSLERQCAYRTICNIPLEPGELELIRRRPGVS